jgi:hypothetical protein
MKTNENKWKQMKTNENKLKQSKITWISSLELHPEWWILFDLEFLNEWKKSHILVENVKFESSMFHFLWF